MPKYNQIDKLENNILNIQLLHRIVFKNFVINIFYTLLIFKIVLFFSMELSNYF